MLTSSRFPPRRPAPRSLHPLPPPSRRLEATGHGGTASPSSIPSRRPISRRGSPLSDSSCFSSPFAPSSSRAPRYNFHLFPRDELNVGMPSYSFSCQTSFISSMAREGIDFNRCIYDGLSYLSRVQESTIKHQNPVPKLHTITSTFTSVADKVFMEKIKVKIEQWHRACVSSNPSEDALVRSLRKLLQGGEVYGSRPCLNIDVCSHRQVLLVAQVLKSYFENLVPLITPDKDGGVKEVKVVLTSSEEDKSLLLNEIQCLEEENEKKFRGFREVIDMIACSQKPIITYNALNDFTFIHSKFIGPLPSSLEEFMCSLRMVFPYVVDINYLMRELDALRKTNSMPAAISQLSKQFFVPVKIEIPEKASKTTGQHHGHLALKITSLFAKLSLLLNINHSDHQTSDNPGLRSIDGYANVFPPSNTVLLDNEDRYEDEVPANVEKVRTSNIIFIWGFGFMGSTEKTKDLLTGSHSIFSEDFDLAMASRNCAVVAFKNPCSCHELLREVASGSIAGSPLAEMIGNGLKIAGFEAYGRALEVGLWDDELADSLEKSFALNCDNRHLCGRKESAETSWNNQLAINLDDL
ncbi:polynucleotidyl transferase, ribonuclease H-like superfamily protein isoform X2 [Wolffia australiana]